MDRQKSNGQASGLQSDSGVQKAGDMLVTGYIRSSHGVDGFVKVESTSGEVAHFADLDGVDLKFGGKEGTVRRFEIEAVEGSAHCLLIKFRGVDTLEQAKKIAGAEILVPRDRACPLEEGEFYVCDLCQCVLVYEGIPVGTIINVMEGGANDLLEVVLTEGSARTVMVPLRKEFVGKIDIKAKTVELMHRWILE
jgi:16S rRNA processing protein RimM